MKQWEMAKIFSFEKYPCMRYFIGDVRDQIRMNRAFTSIDYVIHAAALKIVPTGEYNPFEVIKTNILGAENVINASIDQGVKKVVALSTDKAANPLNLYGATKLCSDKLFIAGNHYASQIGTRFSVVRYGNVLGSRGSVVPLFLKQRPTGRLTLTDAAMTRFWLTLGQGVAFVLRCMENMVGQELFVPKLPSMRLVDLAEAIAPGCEHEIVGIRPGEKIHEVMITSDDARMTLEFDDYYLIQPISGFNHPRVATGTPVKPGFEYNSESNPWQMTIKELRQFVVQESHTLAL